MIGNNQTLTITGPYPEYCTLSMGKHRGIDFYAKPGDLLLSTHDGVVTWVRTGERGGKSSRVMIQPDGADYTITYVHCKPMVKKGDQIFRGYALGECDLSGRTTGGHLHYEVNDPDGNPVEPLQVIAKALPHVKMQLLPGSWDGRSIEWVLKNKNPKGWNAIKDMIV